MERGKKLVEIEESGVEAGAPRNETKVQNTIQTVFSIAA